jgi:translocation and assembly module TamB
MTDREPTSIPPDQTIPPEPPPRGPHSRLRRFFLRHLPLSLAAAAVLLILTAVAAYFIASSAAFENLVRNRLIAQIENATGGRAEIASFHWRLLHLEAEADGVVIHGTEDTGEAPYAEIDRLRVQLSIFGFFTPRISLRDLEIVRPQLHLIVYRDGSTNQPSPRRPAKRAKSAVDSLFDLRANHIAVEHGTLDYDDRAATFDNRHRYLPLDFKADDITLQMIYVPWSFAAPERYRISAAATDLTLTRDLPPKQAPPVHGKLQLDLDLERNRVSLRGLQLTAHSRGAEDRTLQVSGVLDDFTHPRWQAKLAGDLDMRLLDPVTGYPDAPEGIAHLDLAANGIAPAFHIAGSVHVDGGSYTGANIHAIGVNLDARIDADQGKLLITQIVARLRQQSGQQGGEIDGMVALEPWLPGPSVAPAQLTAPGQEESRASRNVLVRAAIGSIPMNGKVTANFKGVALDTILDTVCPPQCRRLGFDARVNGPATATWSNGDDRSVSVTAVLDLSPSAQTPAGEVPASGAIDATYTQRDGGVDLRKFELHLPASDLEARGALGAYPVNSASNLTVDFHSRDLSELDAVLRSLGLNRNGKSGVAALPVSLSGHADFLGNWTGSLIKPHLSGTLKATQLAVEMPSAAGNSGRSRWVHLDSADVQGSYSPTQIAIERALLLHGNSKIELSGALDASPGLGPPATGLRRWGGEPGNQATVPGHFRGSPQPTYDENSVLHAHADGTNLDVADFQPFVGQSLPVTGAFNAQIEASGPLRDLAASGSLQMDRGVVYGESVASLRVEGSLAHNVLKVSSAHVAEAGGDLFASGSYDFNARNFALDAHELGIDISQIGWISRRNLEVAGKLSLSVSGSGSLDDPRLNATATASALTLGGQHFGVLEVSAHTANHNLVYNATTELQGADLHATLAGGTIHLDPLHVTGENTDLRAQGAFRSKARSSSILPPAAPSTSSWPNARSRPDRQRRHHLPG